MTAARLTSSLGTDKRLFGTPLLLLSNVRRKNVFKGSHIAQRPQEEKQPAVTF